MHACTGPMELVLSWNCCGNETVVKEREAPPEYLNFAANQTARNQITPSMPSVRMQCNAMQCKTPQASPPSPSPCKIPIASSNSSSKTTTWPALAVLR
jgi:hypothetical protein